jgi:hypothetical protein
MFRMDRFQAPKLTGPGGVGLGGGNVGAGAAGGGGNRLGGGGGGRRPVSPCAVS